MKKLCKLCVLVYIFLVLSFKSFGSLQTPKWPIMSINHVFKLSEWLMVWISFKKQSCLLWINRFWKMAYVSLKSIGSWVTHTAINMGQKLIIMISKFQKEIKKWINLHCQKHTMLLKVIKYINILFRIISMQSFSICSQGF